MASAVDKQPAAARLAAVAAAGYLPTATNESQNSYTTCGDTTRSNESATPAMTDDTLLPFDLPAVSRKKVTADFAGGSISSDGGLVLLRGAERRLGLAETLAGCIREWRDPDRVVHSLPAMLRFRMFAIACGYEDADDCDELRADPLFKLAVGRAPESGCCSRRRTQVSVVRRAGW